MWRSKLYLLLGSLLGMMVLPALLLLLFQGTQMVLKQTAGQRMEDEALRTLSIKASEAEWEKFGKELLINGTFFDVKSMRRSGDMLLLTGHFDHAETSLVQVLNRLLHHVHFPSLSNLIFLFQCLLSLGFVWLWCSPIPAASNLHRRWQDKRTVPASFPPFTPPWSHAVLF